MGLPCPTVRLSTSADPSRGPQPTSLSCTSFNAADAVVAVAVVANAGGGDSVVSADAALFLVS